METAEKLLVVGGVSILGYGFVLGLPMAMARMRAPEAPRYLVVAHLASIIQGAVLLGLSRAVVVSPLSSGVETLGAVLLVVGVGLFGLGNTLNWLMRVGDHFAERPIGWMILSVSAPLNIAGLAILIVGVARGV